MSTVSKSRSKKKAKVFKKKSTSSKDKKSRSSSDKAKSERNSSKASKAKDRERAASTSLSSEARAPKKRGQSESPRVRTLKRGLTSGLSGDNENARTGEVDETAGHDGEETRAEDSNETTRNSSRESQADIDEVNEALDQHVNENEDGELEVDADGFSREFARQVKENPELTSEIVEAHPEALVELNRQLPDLKDSTAKAYYSSLVGAADQLPRDNREDLKAITNLVTENPEALADQRLLREVAASSAAGGDSRLGESIVSTLKPDHRRIAGFEAATQAGRHAKYIADRAGGDQQDLNQASERLMELSSDLPSGVVAGILDELSRPQGEAPIILTEPQDGGVIGQLLESSLSSETDLATSNALVGALSQASAASQNQETSDAVSRSFVHAVNKVSSPNFDLDFSTERQLAEKLEVGFSTHISRGGNANLGVSVLEGLDGINPLAGEGDDSLRPAPLNRDSLRNSLSNGLTSGLENYQSHLQTAIDESADPQRQLSYLVLNYGEFMDEKELGDAVEEFRDNHQEFARLDGLADSSVANLEALTRLQEVQEEQGMESGLARTTELDDDFLKTTSDALSSPGAQRDLKRLMMKETSGEETFLSSLDERLGNGDEDQAILSKFRLAQVDVATGSAAEAQANGETRTASKLIEALEVSEGLEGLSVDDPGTLVSGLDSILNADTPEALAAAQGDFNELLDGIDAPEGSDLAASLKSKLGVASGAFSVAGLAAQGIEVFKDPTARGVVELSAEAAGVTTDLLESQLSNVFKSSSISTVGNVASGIGIAFSTFDAVKAFQDGDHAQGALHATSAIGSALALSSGAAVTGVGAALVVGAAVGSLALAQYRRVEASNEFESEDTKRFIRRALADSDLEGNIDPVLSELNNADNEGRLTGVLIHQAAEVLDVKPNDLFNQIAELDPGEIKEIVTEGHSVDPEDDGDFTDLKRSEVEEFAELLRETYGLAA